MPLRNLELKYSIKHISLTGTKIVKITLKWKVLQSLTKEYMELLPIIKASLGIFTLLTSVTFIVSFVIYKIKNRHSAKPYERKPVIFDSSLILEVHDTPEEKINNNLYNNKFEVLNQNADSNQTNKIFLKNSERNSGKSLNPSVSEDFNNIPIAKTHRRSPNEVFNIYNFYSNNDVRTMHKLKVKPITVR